MRRVQWPPLLLPLSFSQTHPLADTVVLTVSRSCVLITRMKSARKNAEEMRIGREKGRKRGEKNEEKLLFLLLDFCPQKRESIWERKRVKRREKI